MNSFPHLLITQQQQQQHGNASSGYPPMLSSNNSATSASIQSFAPQPLSGNHNGGGAFPFANHPQMMHPFVSPAPQQHAYYPGAMVMGQAPFINLTAAMSMGGGGERAREGCRPECSHLRHKEVGSPPNCFRRSPRNNNNNSNPKTKCNYLVWTRGNRGCGCKTPSLVGVE